MILSVERGDRISRPFRQREPGTAAAIRAAIVFLAVALRNLAAVAKAAELGSFGG